MNVSESKRINKGQSCPSAGETRYVTLSRINKLAKELIPSKTKYIMDEKKKDIIKIYDYEGKDIKQIVNTKKAISRQNIALISPTQLCVETELLFRYLNEIKKNDKLWFFSSVEDAINRISNIKK